MTVQLLMLDVSKMTCSQNHALPPGWSWQPIPGGELVPSSVSEMISYSEGHITQAWLILSQFSVLLAGAWAVPCGWQRLWVSSTFFWLTYKHCKAKSPLLHATLFRAGQKASPIYYCSLNHWVHRRANSFLFLSWTFFFFSWIMAWFTWVLWGQTA